MPGPPLGPSAIGLGPTSPYRPPNARHELARKPRIAQRAVIGLGLERRSLGEVASLMHEFPVCSNGNYMMGDGAGRILDVELTSDG